MLITDTDDNVSANDNNSGHDQDKTNNGEVKHNWEANIIELEGQ